jgi:hypothetical protein
MNDLDQNISDETYWNDLYRRSIPNAIQRIEEISKLLATLTSTLITLYIGVILFNANIHLIVENLRFYLFLVPVLFWGVSLITAISPAIPSYYHLDNMLEKKEAIKQVFERNFRGRRRRITVSFYFLAIGIIFMVGVMIWYFILLGQSPNLIEPCKINMSCIP